VYQGEKMRESPGNSAPQGEKLNGGKSDEDRAYSLTLYMRSLNKVNVCTCTLLFSVYYCVPSMLPVIYYLSNPAYSTEWVRGNG
jgi:hypothetical protein